MYHVKAKIFCPLWTTIEKQLQDIAKRLQCEVEFHVADDMIDKHQILHIYGGVNNVRDYLEVLVQFLHFTEAGVEILDQGEL